MEVKVQRERLQCFLIKLCGFWLHRAALKHVGQPRRRDRAKGVIAADRNLSRDDGADCTGISVLSVGAESGRRSPFRVRSTATAGVKERKPVLGKDGKAIKLATNRPETTATMRTNRMRPIGRSADFTPLFSRRTVNRWRGNRTKRARASSVGALFSPACDAHAHTCVRRRSVTRVGWHRLAL